MNIVITGAGAGLGAAIAKAIDIGWRHGESPRPNVHLVDHKFGHDIRVPQGSMNAPACYDGPKIVPCPKLDKVDVLINCAAINRIAWFEDVDNELWEQTMSTNAMGMWKMTKYYLGALCAQAHIGFDAVAAKVHAEANQGRDASFGGQGGTVLNIVSNASHMPMRCSLAYNASKGAAHIMTLQMARELYDKHGITVFGISPNKLAGTEMSADIDKQVVETRGWTPEQARAYQLQGLATHEETDPRVLAEFIAFLLSSKERHRYLHGCIIPYGA